MKIDGYKKMVSILAFALVLGLVASANASAVTKTIICYKSTSIKRVVAVHPKCAIGWSTTKPKPAPSTPATKPKPAASTPATTPKPTASTPATTPKPTASTPAATPKPTAISGEAFNATFKGSLAMLWSDTNVTVTSIRGVGSGTNLGLTNLSGTGSAAPASQCDAVDGDGVLTGPDGTLKVTFKNAAKGCAADGAAPTMITLTGNAIITGGTGKFAGATGTLKANGSFTLKSTEAGNSESEPFTLTLTGTINLK